MAIFKCPDCGNNVSTTADRCPHCGMVFTACPECGKIYKGQLEKCPNCGAVFGNIEKQQAVPVQQPTQKSKNETLNEKEYSDSTLKLEDLWKVKQPEKADVAKKISYADKALNILTGLLDVIAIVIYLMWFIEENSLSKFEEMSGILDTVSVIVWISAVIAILGVFTDIAKEYYMLTHMTNWVRVSGIDAAKYFAKYVRENSADQFTDIGFKGDSDTALKCFYLAKKPNEIALLYISMEIKVVSSIFLFIVVATKFLEIFEYAGLCILFEQPFDYDWTSFIVLACIGIAGIFAAAITEMATIERKSKAEIKKEMIERGLVTKSSVSDAE